MSLRDCTSQRPIAFVSHPNWVITIQALVLLLTVHSAGVQPATTIEAVQWQPYDIRLAASQDHPWWSFPAKGQFVHAQSQTELDLKAFWDGERHWVIRFAPTLPGLWTYTTASNDPGLRGRSGRFQVRRPTPEEIEENPNLRGHLKISPNGRYFQRADGTPFFLMASTLWAANTARCGLGSHQDGPFYQIISFLKRKGFTAILMQFFHGYGDYQDSPGHRNEGGKPFVGNTVEELNPKHFRFLDVRMRALWEAGLVAATPTTWFGKTRNCLFTIEDAKRISAYCRVRYGAFPGLWSLSGEYQYNFQDCAWTHKDITALGQVVQSHNPYGHPLSIHPSGRTDWPAPHNVQSSLPFHGEDWLDHHWLQTGQSLDRVYNIVLRAQENRALMPPMPVFCSESYYEAADDPEKAYHARWQAWTAFLNGCAGYGYGARGMWQFYDPEDPAGETGKVTRGVIPWKTAIEFPGPSVLSHVSSLLQAFDWWRLEPHSNRLRVDGKPCPKPTPNDTTPPQAAAIPNRLWIIYIPRGNGARIVSFDLPIRGKIKAGRWYDPRRGAFMNVDLPELHKGGRLPERPAPADEDWVFVLEINHD